MSQPFVAEIRMFSFNFAPRSWAFCNGQLLPIAQNQALFSLLGTTYGGNGTVNFALPNLQGRTPIEAGTGPGLPSVTLGQTGGEEAHTLTTQEMPAHQHTSAGSSNNPSQTSPNGGYPATFTADNVYTTPANGAMNAGTVANTGGSQPHPNIQPYLVVNICIALAGIFPSRN